MEFKYMFLLICFITILTLIITTIIILYIKYQNPPDPDLHKSSFNFTLSSPYSAITIVYYMGHSVVPFAATDEGLGGSETAVVELARYFCQRGFTTEVYGRVLEGFFDGVRYYDYQKFDITKKGPIYLIIHRHPGCAILNTLDRTNYIKVILDLHDADDPRYFPIYSINAKISKIALKSQYHKKLYFPGLDNAEKKFIVIPNGVKDFLEFKNLRKIKKNAMKIIYTSCYTRGLEGLLTYSWKLIHKHFPEAELHLCYGMNLVPPDLKNRLINLIENSPNVYDHGRLSREQMRVLNGDALVHLYPCNSISEIDCIAIKESALAGIIPVIPTQFVFGERAGYHFDNSEVGSKNFFKAAGVLTCQIIDAYNTYGNEQYQLMLKQVDEKIGESVFTWDQVCDFWIRSIIFG